MDTEKKLVFVATDGHRLAISENSKSVEYAICKDTKRNHDLRRVQSYYFDIQTNTYTATLETNFSNYMQDIPKNHTHIIEFGINKLLLDMLKAIKAVKNRYPINKYANPTRTQPTIIIDPVAQRIYTSAHDSLRIEVTFRAAGWSTLPTDIVLERFGVDALYLLDALLALQKTTTYGTMYIDGPLNALKIGTSRTPTEMHVIMPIRLMEDEPSYDDRNEFFLRA